MPTSGLSAAIAVVVLPLYGAQSLSAPIAASFGLAQETTGLIAMMPMLGYATGLVLLVPLIDIFTARKVILSTLLAGIAGLAAAGCSPSAGLFILAAFIVGATTSATQMLVPLAASQVNEAERGRVIGNVMSGLMIGVLLSRPTANMSAELVGWRGAYLIDAALLGGVLLMCVRILPDGGRPSGLSYVGMVRSLGVILRDQPVLRRRAACQALCMGAFGAFWTGVPLLLAQPPFELSETGIAAFALAGAGGAVVAPLAGQAADRGLGNAGTRIAHAFVAAGATFALVFGAGGFGFDPNSQPRTALALLVFAAVVLDLGVIGDQTLGRHAVNALRSEIRGRLNGLYTGLFFVGGAAGSALAGIAWAQHGWALVCTLGIAFGAGAFALGLVTGLLRRNE